MNRVYTLVEQLDIAAEQLRGGTPLGGRLALILADNAVELVLHNSADTAILMDGSLVRRSWASSAPEFDAATRREALGNYFDGKVRFCQRIGLIDEREAKFIRTAHAYRNELYHAGLRHEEIIHPIAWHYHELACAMVPRLRSFGWLMVEPETDRVRKHFPNGDYFQPPEDLFRGVVESLTNERPQLTKALPEALSEFAEDMVDRARYAVDFLVENNFSKWDERRILRHVQLHEYAFGGEFPRLDTSGMTKHSEFVHALNELERNWTPKWERVPEERWRRRARDLRNDDDPYRALEKFQQLYAEVSPFEELFGQAAGELEHEIELQSDY